MREYNVFVRLNGELVFRVFAEDAAEAAMLASNSVSNSLDIKADGLINFEGIEPFDPVPMQVTA